MAKLRDGRVRHARMGRLVQQPQTAGADRQHAAGRSRSALLCATRGSRGGSLTKSGRPTGRGVGFSRFVAGPASRLAQGTAASPAPDLGRRSAQRAQSSPPKERDPPALGGLLLYAPLGLRSDRRRRRRPILAQPRGPVSFWRSKRESSTPEVRSSSAFARETET
jgi:hypothetical protein